MHSLAYEHPFKFTKADSCRIPNPRFVVREHRSEDNLIINDPLLVLEGSRVNIVIVSSLGLKRGLYWSCDQVLWSPIKTQCAQVGGRSGGGGAEAHMVSALDSGVISGLVYDLPRA